jgi:adenylylsulfate kinase
MSRGAFAIWMTGLPASGKSTIRKALAVALADRGIRVAVLESDSLRKVLGHGYDEAGRERFYGAVLWIGRLLLDHGVSVIFDATANRRRWREQAREAIPLFLEVFVDTPLEVCMARDPKGIYAGAKGDDRNRVPGLGAPYEPPLRPEVRVDGADAAPQEAADEILRQLVRRGLVTGGGA